MLKSAVDLERRNLDLQKKNNDQALKISYVSSSFNTAGFNLSAEESRIAN
jgi:hypothetical protein